MGRFITEWAWEDDRKPEPIGEGTLLFFDRGQDDHDGGPVLVGFVAWCLRKERVHGPKEYVGLFHLIFVAPAYRGEKTIQGPSIVSTMFATAEKVMQERGKAVMQEHGKPLDDMPLRIDVNVGNDHARNIYTKRWGFKHWKWRPKPPAEPKYEVLLREATAPKGDTTPE